MVGVYIAHDCQVGDHVIIANNGTLGEHVIVEDYAIIGGLAAIHQYVRIGAHAMIGGMTGVEGDVLPFTSVSGERGKLTKESFGLRRCLYQTELLFCWFMGNFFLRIYVSGKTPATEKRICR